MSEQDLIPEEPEERPTLDPAAQLGDEPLIEAEESTEGQDDGEQDTIDELREAIEALQLRIEQMEIRHATDGGEDSFPFKNPFPARVNTNGTFTELLAQGGTMSAFADGRANDTTSSFLHLSDGQGLMLEIEDADGSGNTLMNWLFLPNPATAAYLSNNTGGGYDVFADSGRTIRLASNLTPETQSGLFAWNGTTGRLILPSTTQSSSSAVTVETGVLTGSVTAGGTNPATIGTITLASTGSYLISGLLLWDNLFTGSGVSEWTLRFEIGGVNFNLNNTNAIMFNTLIGNQAANEHYTGGMALPTRKVQGPSVYCTIGEGAPTGTLTATFNWVAMRYA